MSRTAGLDSQIQAAAEQLAHPGVAAVALGLVAIVGIPMWLVATVHAPGRVARALAAASGRVQLPPRERRPTPEAFANAMAELTSGVCLVTAAGRDGVPCGMVATSLCSYSADPPAVLVCVGPRGRCRDAILSADAFAVHVLCDEQEEVARWFARPGADKFAAVDWYWDDGVPALTPEHAVAYLRCTRVAIKRHGDHAIVIGEVDRVEVNPTAPLVYLRRRMDWRLESA